MNLKRLLLSLCKTTGLVMAVCVGAVIASLIEHYHDFDSRVVAAAVIFLTLWVFVHITQKP